MMMMMMMMIIIIINIIIFIIIIILFLIQNVKLAGSDMDNRVTTSMTLQPKLGVLLEQPAKVGVQTCP